MTAFFLQFKLDFIKQDVNISFSLECSLPELLLVLDLSVQSTIWVQILGVSLVHPCLFIID